MAVLLRQFESSDPQGQRKPQSGVMHRATSGILAPEAKADQAAPLGCE